MNDTIAELESITLVRGQTTILSGITWAIQRGEHWAMLGANGSGKTTLLKVLTGYEWPTEGSVTVLGNRYGQCNLPEVRKTIGWVSTAIEHRLPTGDTALQVAASGLDASMGLYRDLTSAEWQQARDALDHLGAGSVADRRFGLLSQGEQQRVLIARALVNRPALMILDEPCAGLDPAARDDFLADLGKMSEKTDAPTMVLVTHHIEEIGPWINRVLVLREGKPLAAGKTADVLTGNVLGKAFGRKAQVKREAGRYFLRLDPPK